MRVGFHLTDRCQLDCDHCVRDPGRRPVDLPLAVIDAVLREARVALDIRQVSITGGEPTLHPEFPEVLDLVTHHGMTWDMVTNGGRFGRVAQWLDDVPARATACRRIAFSLDGASPAVHDGIRGDGQFREVLGAMAVAVAVGIPFSVTATLHARNVAEIEDLARLAAELGAQVVRFAMMHPTGTHLDADLALTVAQWHDAYRRIRALQPALTIPVIAAEGWPTAEDRTHVCGPLRGETLHVDHHGRLTLCCAHSQAPGDDGARTIAGDVRTGLTANLAKLAEIRDAARRGDAEPLPGGWSAFGCNACLARYGRPHWTDSGVRGAVAARERWNGAWARSSPRKRSLPLAD